MTCQCVAKCFSKILVYTEVLKEKKKEQTILSSHNERRTQTQNISSTTLLSYQSKSYEYSNLNFQRGLAIWHKSISSSLICLMMAPVTPLLLTLHKKVSHTIYSERTPAWKVHPHSSPFHCAKQVRVVICKCFTLPKVNYIKNEYQFLLGYRLSYIR